MLASLNEVPAYCCEDDNNTVEVLYHNGGVAISKQDIGKRSPETIINMSMTNMEKY